MSDAFAVSVLVGEDPVDPASLVEAVSATARPGSIQIDRTENTVRFIADQRATLTQVAEPLAAWWQQQGPGAVLRFAFPFGISEITYAAPEFAVDVLQQLIAAESGPIRNTDEVVAGEHGSGRSRRGRRAGAFTARVVGVADEGGVLCVGVAERRDGTGRSLILQGIGPASEQADLLDDDEGYCVVTETAATTYGGVTALTLRDRMLRLRLTRTAASALGLPTTLRVTLEVDDQAIETLRAGLRTVFSYGSGQEPPPQLDLE